MARNNKKRDSFKSSREEKGSQSTSSRVYPKRNADSGKKSEGYTFKYTEGDGTCVSKPNDVSWYAKNADLLQSGASFPYGYPVGSLMDLSNKEYPHAGKLVVSGICAINILPFPGVSKDLNSPVNIAARKLYSWIRHANSGRANYDPNDLMMYILAMDSIYSMYWHGVRAYGTMMLYNQQNRYVPDALLAALGFDPQDLKRNYAQLRFGLLKIATQVNNLVVPDTMDVFKRHRWCFSNLYADGTSPKSQIYFYRPEGYYTFEFVETTDLQPRLGYTKIDYPSENESSTPKLFTVESFLQVLDSMIYPVMSNYNEDFGIISGDIIKAYDASQLYRLPPFPENYAVIPAYSEEVLSQIQNATLLGRPVLSSLDITQDNDPSSATAGAILCNPQWQLLSATSSGFQDIKSFSSSVDITEYDVRCMNRLVSFNLDAPKPADTMVGTRLTNILVPNDAGTYLELDSSGTEIATVAYVYRMKTGANNAPDYTVRNFYLDKTVQKVPLIFKDSSGNIQGSSGYMTSQVADMLGDIIRLSHFRFHPMVIISLFNTTYMANANTNKLTSNGEFMVDNFELVGLSGVSNFYAMEIDNYTGLSKPDLDQLHAIAVLSEYDI